MSSPRTGNGWPVQEPGSVALRTWTIPGANRRLTLRDHHVGFCLIYLASWFNDIIERLDGPGNDAVDEGGYNHRPIAGTNTWSEHAAGVAEDLNWARHPQHTRPEQTFTKAQVRRIRAKLLWFKMLAGGTVFEWGGDWSVRYLDPMHFQAVRGRLLLLARILWNTKRGRRIRNANPGVTIRQKAKA